MAKAFPQFSKEFFDKYQCPPLAQRRKADAVNAIAYHGTQGPTARGGAITLTTRTNGSAHEVHDRKEGYKIAPDKAVLCGVTDANTGIYHIEDATFANWVRKIWLLYKRTLQMSAWRMARKLHEHGIRNHFIGLQEAERAGSAANLHGYTYHNVLSLTTWCDSTHQDPAPGAGITRSTFPHRRFVQWVDFYYAHPNIDRPIKRRELRAWIKAGR